MSLIEEAVFTKLTTTAAVSALIGTRMRPQLAAEADQYPMLVYDKESDGALGHMSGTTHLSHCTISLDAWATTYAAAKAIRDAVRTALKGYSGTSSSVQIRRAMLIENRDRLESAVGMEQRRMYAAGLNIDIWYAEL